MHRAHVKSVRGGKQGAGRAGGIVFTFRSGPPPGAPPTRARDRVASHDFHNGSQWQQKGR